MRTVEPEQWYKKRNMPALLRSRQDPPEDVETRVRNSFCDAMNEYWLDCSVEGVKWISDRNLSKFERCNHASVLMLALWVGVSVLSYNVYRLGGWSSTQVDLQSSQHFIQQVPFPAVALCSSNVISNGPLVNYTSFLVSHDKNHTYQSWYIRQNLLKFAALLTMELPSVDIMFMQFLTHADPDFNMTKLMYQLSSPCASILTRCSWRGRVVPCDHLFATRVTPLGYCCVFNSRYYPEDIYQPPKYLDMVGQDYGLSVLVQENTDDFVCIRRASIGLEVLLFDGSEYPLLQGGGVRMYPVQRNASVYMSVSASAQYPAAEVESKCRVRSTGGARGARSYAWCLAQCQWRTLATLCACRLHTFPPDPTDDNPVCSLTHLSCLNKHREKFIYYYPGSEYYSDPGLNEELQNGLVCHECAPDCTRYVYSADVASARYSSTSINKIFKNMFSTGQSLVNGTVIRLFYLSNHQKLYTIQANHRWFESFAAISSTWTGIFGATVVAGSEFMFFFTIRWMHHFRRRTRMVTRRSNAGP